MSLVIRENPLPGSNSIAPKKLYLGFQRAVQKLLGWKGVVLCAGGLGMSAIASMGEQLRADLAS